ncbi:hypothetical protein NCCP2222_29590 [Sporosarcina sp. NCCP-2222]|uniref:hypothetical protein n=1 Tax=Sporosarcina sp. NCCP-2222 TaxID=2935073 RepID=UPI00208772D5|nr:hypothetical protein [Sporosarcina sp. NCCP-2222]GKV57012.1 hypothetical protein NCCP2222_29590 [Sporosarcina sp. NCCP-2222]
MSEIEQHLEKLYDSMRWVGLATGKNWSHIKFYEYFSSPEKHIRAGAIFSFYGMLIQWESGSSFPFKVYDGQPDMFHKLDEYLSNFLENAEEIAKEFPGLYCAIATVLKKLDDMEDIERVGYRFPDIGEELRDRMRVTLFKDEILNSPDASSNYYNQACEEVGLSKEYR